MSTAADYKAMVTTEISVPLAQITEQDTLKLLGKNGRHLKILENNTGTRCSWDRGDHTVSIHGEPKAVKHAYTHFMAQMSKFASVKGTTAPDTMVNMLSKEYNNGVFFCKLTDAVVASDDDDILLDEVDKARINKKLAKPAVYVIHPTAMTDEQKQQGRIMASDLWRSAQFVTADFRENVIQDASMVLRRQLSKIPQGEGNYLKLEMDIGKVIFNENDQRAFPLQGAKFAISDFRHIRFTKEITCDFRKEWEESWIAQLRDVLSMLGYDQSGSVTKIVKIAHTAQREDGKCYDVVWSTDLCDPRRQCPEKTGTLDFIKSRVRGDNPFSFTVYGPATAFDLRFSIVTNTRETAENNQEIEERVRRAYRYSAKRGILVNHPYENTNGYTPLISPRARLIRETTWMRGDIKVIINEIQSGPESSYEVKVQSNLLKKYTRDGPDETPLSDVVEAMKEYLEAAEEINGELDLLTAQLPPKEPPRSVVMEDEVDSIFYPRAPSSIIPQSKYYGNLGASIHSYGTPKFRDGSSPRVANNWMFDVAQSKTDSIRSAPPAAVSAGTEVFWEGRVVGTPGEFGFGTPVLIPAKNNSQGSSSPPERILSPKTDQQRSVSRGSISPPSSDSSETGQRIHRIAPSGNQTPTSESIPPHLRPVVKSPKPSTSVFDYLSSSESSSPDKQLDSSYNSNGLSDQFVNILDSTIDDDRRLSVGVLTPKKVVSPKPGRMKIDFFGSVGALEGGDAGDLLSWSPDNAAFDYVHENDPLDMEVLEGVSLLLD